MFYFLNSSQIFLDLVMYIYTHELVVPLFTLLLYILRGVLWNLFIIIIIIPFLFGCVERGTSFQNSLHGCKVTTNGLACCGGMACCFWLPRPPERTHTGHHIHSSCGFHRSRLDVCAKWNQTHYVVVGFSTIWPKKYLSAPASDPLA